MTTIDEVLTQIDHDFSNSITSIRQLFAHAQYNATEKRLISKKILAKLELMKKEVEPWSK